MWGIAWRAEGEACSLAVRSRAILWGEPCGLPAPRLSPELHAAAGISFGGQALWAHHLESPRVHMGSWGGVQREFQGKGAAPAPGNSCLLREPPPKQTGLQKEGTDVSTCGFRGALSQG